MYSLNRIDEVMAWKPFLHHWLHVRGSEVNSHHDPVIRAYVFFANALDKMVEQRVAGDLRCHDTHLTSLMTHNITNYNLILFSDTPSGLKKQLNGLLKFCSNNKIIVNEIKTNSMCFGTNENLNVFFNGKPIQQVSPWCDMSIYQ